MAKKSKQDSKVSYDPGFAPVPYAAMRDIDISIEARGLLALLMTHSASWQFHRSDIMKKAGCKKDKYNRMIGELKSAGYLEINALNGDGGKFGGGYQWIIHPIPKTEDPINPPSGEPDIGKSGPIREQSLKETTLEDPLNPPEGEISAGDIFDKLWKFISKVTPDEFMGRHSKKNGRAKFIKLSERDKDPYSPGPMAHAICWFYSQSDQQRDGAKYIKGIVPVLNGELFESFMAKGPYGSMVERSPEELAADKDPEYWDFWVRRYQDQGDWNAPGPKPGDAGCLADKDILSKYNYDVRE